MSLALAVGTLDCVYLTWRFVALQAGWVEPGTGLCSWSAGIDCDKVLSTPEARSFYLPNAVLGLGFFSGALLWWWGGRRWLPAALQPWVIRALTPWLALATLLTLWFIHLLVQLPALCPFCPWNHLWTWLALGAGVAIQRATPPIGDAWRVHAGALAGWVALCVTWCVLWLALRVALTELGVFGAGGPPPLFGG